MKKLLEKAEKTLVFWLILLTLKPLDDIIILYKIGRNLPLIKDICF